jgi:hypothetical protein
MLCPKCKIDTAHRSHRVGLRERLTSIVGYVPYRCRECRHRFLGFRYSLREPAPPACGAEKEIAATRGSLRRKQRRHELVLYASALAVFVVILYYLTREPSMGG